MGWQCQVLDYVWYIVLLDTAEAVIFAGLSQVVVWLPDTGRYVNLCSVYRPAGHCQRLWGLQNTASGRCLAYKYVSMLFNN